MIAKAYTPESIWRNRHFFFTGTDEIVKFLTWKWEKERNYKLRKELFSFTDNKIAVQFWVRRRAHPAKSMVVMLTKGRFLPVRVSRLA